MKFKRGRIGGGIGKSRTACCINTGMTRCLIPICGEREGWKLVVPKNLHERVLHEAHSVKSAAHLGVEKTYDRLARDYFWRGMYHDVHEFVRTCDTCQRYKFVQTGPQGLMGKRVLEEPWAVVACDCMEFPTSKAQNKYLIVLQDLFTRWIEVRPVRRATGARGEAEEGARARSALGCDVAAEYGRGGGPPRSPSPAPLVMTRSAIKARRRRVARQRLRGDRRQWTLDDLESAVGRCSLRVDVGEPASAPGAVVDLGVGQGSSAPAPIDGDVGFDAGEPRPAEMSANSSRPTAPRAGVQRGRVEKRAALNAGRRERRMRLRARIAEGYVPPTTSTETGAVPTRNAERRHGTLFGELDRVVVDPTIDPPPGVCFECWGKGHVALNCPQKGARFCVNCGRRGCLIGDCARCGRRWRWISQRAGEGTGSRMCEQGPAPPQESPVCGWPGRAPVQHPGWPAHKSPALAIRREEARQAEEFAHEYWRQMAEARRRRDGFLHLLMQEQERRRQGEWQHFRWKVSGLAPHQVPERNFKMLSADMQGLWTYTSIRVDAFKLTNTRTDICACTRMYTQIYVAAKGFVNIYGHTRNIAELREIPRNITEYRGISRNSVKYHGIPRNTTEYHEIVRNTTELRGTTRNITELRGIRGMTRNITDFHGIKLVTQKYANSHGITQIMRKYVESHGIKLIKRINVDTYDIADIGGYV
ncbi:unnamed protein product [Trichogramma brassicae]|uniref:RNA-directed DNA polymerase n=1 Tax=Trichogramma brassicae TaxID=86971 RepID=A0A6H5J1Y7_9HYME|nr:unnamed protein product [Trichogramma brassicae]